MTIFNRKLKHKINLLQDKVDLLEKQLEVKKNEISKKNSEILKLRIKAYPPLYQIGDKIGGYLVIDYNYLGNENICSKYAVKLLPILLLGFPYFNTKKAQETFAYCSEASKLYEKEGWVYTVLNENGKVQRTEAQLTELKNETDAKENN